MEHLNKAVWSVGVQGGQAIRLSEVKAPCLELPTCKPCTPSTKLDMLVLSRCFHDRMAMLIPGKYHAFFYRSTNLHGMFLFPELFLKHSAFSCWSRAECGDAGLTLFHMLFFHQVHVQHAQKKQLRLMVSKHDHDFKSRNIEQMENKKENMDSKTKLSCFEVHEFPDHEFCLLCIVFRQSSDQKQRKAWV